MSDYPKILLDNVGVPDSHTLSVYRSRGGYAAAEKALKSMKAEEVVSVVKESGLRGRGGAGFPTGVKWGFVPKDSKKPVYLLVNADESEPGTFKDRDILDYDPHKMIEGIIISSYAVNCHEAFIYIRGEYGWLVDRVQQAVDEAYQANLLGKDILGSGYDLEVIVHKGAGAYICGEETGLINSLEGKKGQPRIKPPFPAVVGFLDSPTVVNNVETLASVPWIIQNGADAYRSIGTEKSPGTKLFSLSGPVKRPGVYEVPLGLPLRELIFGQEFGQGMLPGIELKACIPGGSSVPVLNAEETMAAMLDYESLSQLGTMLGSGGCIVIGDDAKMPELLKVVLQFYHHESCGQCTPCREGTGWLDMILKRMLEGQGRPKDLDLIERLCGNMMGTTICVLSDAAVMPARSFISKFRDEFEALLPKGEEPEDFVPTARAAEDRG
ncbi:MAG TPA: NADH-quinone oxidoreductase subunit NuoF [Candidatus Krumholzibacteria bacterium]|nr:NADH-quinone oxidoreductase subunit NuoF [Candidatus Krumholzibacteria bacterium]